MNKELKIIQKEAVVAEERTTLVFTCKDKGKLVRIDVVPSGIEQSTFLIQI
jgi:hypothetical protein